MKQYDTTDLDIFLSLTGSHFEVTEGETFTVTLTISGPDARAGLQIPYRIIGTVRPDDYLPSVEYGLFVIGSDLTSTLTFKAKVDPYNEPDQYFIVALHYYPTVQRLTTIKNVYIPPSPKPPEPTPNPPTFELITYQTEVIGGNEAIFYIISHNMRPGVKLPYYIQTNGDQYPKEAYVYSENNGISEIKISTSPTTIRRFLRVWLKRHPKITSQLIIVPSS